MLEKLDGQLLNKRTGTGQRSIFYRVGIDGKDVYIVVGADLEKAVYMRVQELGATIVPTHSQYLTIPLAAVLTGNGVARFSARDVISDPGAYGYVGTFFHNQVLFGKLQGGGIEPLFALKKSVTIKPVGYLHSTFDEQVEHVVDAFAQSILDR